MVTRRNKLDELERCSKAEEYSLRLILEFLEYKGLRNTTEALKDEILAINSGSEFPEIIKTDRILESDVENLIELLESSDHKLFFEKWDTSVPESIKKSLDYKKLTIYLHTYYATLSFHSEKKEMEKIEKRQPLIEQDVQLNTTFIIEKPCQKNVPNIDEIENEGKNIPKAPDSAMRMYKEFLFNHGTEFADDPEFLPYFALSFVENPKNHPTFEQFFKDDWKIELTKKFNAFLLKYSCGDEVIPEIIKISKEKGTESQKIDKNAQKSFKDLKRKMHKLKRDHQKLVGVASELANALEKSVQGEAVDLKLTLMNCSSIFPDLFSSDEQEFFDSLMTKKQILHSHLDGSKIKNDLFNSGIKTQLLLLQALRLHITQSDQEEREDFVLWISRQDILGLKNSEIDDFLKPAIIPHPLQQSILRLLNAIVSLNCGRDYIESSLKTVETLIGIFLLKGLDETSGNMITSVIQKLSLRKKLCDLMIERGIVDDVVEKIKTQSSNKYIFEHLSQLLMNLSLQAPISYWNKYIDFTTYLIDLLMITDDEVKEFLTGALCCILRNELVNKQCVKEGLGVKLSRIYSKNKEHVTLGKQMDTLLKLHRREISPYSLCLDQNCEDEMEDPEKLDSEIDAHDLVKGPIYGEDFLEGYCLIFPHPRMLGRSMDKTHREPRSSSLESNLPNWAKGN